jgi:hypothetical protein
VRGHGQKLGRKQEAVIAALLTEPNHADAARKAGVAEATLYRWLNMAEFQAAYRAARRQVVEAAVGRLQQAAGQAVDTLVKNLTCGVYAAENRAAVAILEQGAKAVEILDLNHRP